VDYALLGRSGLRVSPLALGTMTFGTEWGWGAPEEACRRLLDAYLDAGGNFVDTADGYTGGTAESLLGKFFRARGDRDRVVLATKYAFNQRAGDPNAGGNGRKNLRRALEGSLKRLQTDYVDVYFLHAWDGVTPIEEVVAALDEVVRAGMVRAIAFSNVPAWWAARAVTLAEQLGRERCCALQFEYSLVERNIEREHVPLALALGLAVMPWSPLASGMLTGRYRGAGADPVGEGRLAALKAQGNPAFTKLFTERNWRIVDVLVDVARAAGRPPAQVALSWIVRRPGVVSTVLGATKPEQLLDNLTALDFALDPALSARLEEASRPETVHPYLYFEPEIRAMITGKTTVRAEPETFR
jgi:aryl-alcohol dehydrogenase-like predicted oxidoreductase